MNDHDPNYRPLHEMPSAPDPVRDEVRPTRPRLTRELRMVRWAGCAFFSAEEVPEVPEGAELRVRFGLVHEGEELPFERKPFPLSVTPTDIHRRFGPWRYVVQLVWIDATAPGNPIRKVLSSRHYEIRSKGELDVGREPWPINLSSPEIPRSLIDEIERRASIRGDAEGDQGSGYSGGGYSGGGGSGYSGGGGSGYSGGSGGSYAVAYGSGGYGDPRGRGRGYDEDEDDEDDDGPPPRGFSWVRFRGRRVLMRDTDDEQGDDPLGLMKRPQPAPPPAPSLFGSLLSRPPEEVLALAAGVMKLLKDAGGSNANAEVERERVRAEYEVRKQEMAQQHAMFLKQMELQQQQFALASRPEAPPVNAEQVRAQALAEARLEALQREQQRLVEELRSARNTPRAEQPDLLQQIARIKQQAEALGLNAKPAAAGSPPPPTFLEQAADFLDTAGGKAIVERLADKVLGSPHEPPPQAPQVVQTVPAMPPQPQQLAQGYAISEADDAGEFDAQGN